MFSNTGNNEPMVTLHLSLSQVNVVLAGLGELPLKVSRTVSTIIENQAQADLKHQQEFMARGAAPQTPEPQPEASQEAGAQGG